AMPNRRGRTLKKAKRPSSVSLLSKPKRSDGGVCDIGASAIAIGAFYLVAHPRLKKSSRERPRKLAPDRSERLHAVNGRGTGLRTAGTGGLKKLEHARCSTYANRNLCSSLIDSARVFIPARTSRHVTKSHSVLS